PRSIRDNLLQVVAVTIDRNDSWKVLHFEFPDRFRAAELFEANAQDPLHALCIDLCGAADGVKVHAAVLLTGLLSLGSHAAFSNDSLDAEALDDVGLVRFFTNRRGWASRHDAI